MRCDQGLSWDSGIGHELCGWVGVMGHMGLAPLTLHVSVACGGFFSPHLVLSGDKMTAL